MVSRVYKHLFWGVFALCILMFVAAYSIFRRYMDYQIDVGSFNTEVGIIEPLRQSALESDPEEILNLLDALPGSFQSFGPPDRGSGIDKALEHYKEGVMRELIHRLRSFDVEKMDNITSTRARKYLGL